MKKNYRWMGIIVVVALASFTGGMFYGKSSAPKNAIGNNWQNQAGRGAGGPGGQGGGMMRRNGAGGQAGGGFVNGEILSKDANSLTIKLNDGGSKLVFLSNKTTINKMATGTPSDLEVGKNVMVTGSAGNDGNVTAEAIQLRPAFAPGDRQVPTGASINDKATK